MTMGVLKAIPSGECSYDGIKLTTLNTVVFLGNYHSDSNGLVCTVPEQCRPISQLKIVCACTPYSISGTGNAIVKAPTGITTVEVDVFPKPVSGGLSSMEYDSLTTNRVAINMPTFESQTITVNVTAELGFDVLEVNPDGTVMGRPDTEYFMNGISYDITANLYDWK